MPNLKKQMKKIQREQERLEEIIRLQQSTCPHVSKKGKSKLVEFQDGDVLKGRCKRCGDVVILDKNYLGDKELLKSSTEIVKTMLAELRAAARTGKIRIDDDTLGLIVKFDAEILRDLPQTFEVITTSEGGKGKKKKKKKNKRERWS